MALSQRAVIVAAARLVSAVHAEAVSFQFPVDLTTCVDKTFCLTNTYVLVFALINKSLDACAYGFRLQMWFSNSEWQLWLRQRLQMWTIKNKLYSISNNIL